MCVWHHTKRWLTLFFELVQPLSGSEVMKLLVALGEKTEELVYGAGQQ